MVYIIMCSRGKKSTETVYIRVQAEDSTKVSLVHETAATGFRNQFNLGSNIAVNTTTLYKAETEEKIKDFIHRMEDLGLEIKGV